MMENQDQIKSDSQKLKEAEAEIKTLQDELLETNSGIIALYNDLNDANLKLVEKNEELNKTLRELKETQDKLIQSEKMAAIGSVVVTYNHHINNPLMIILGNVQLLLMKQKNFDDNTLKSLKLVEDECKRISEVTTKIKEYEKLIPVKYLDSMFEMKSPSKDSKPS
ncbi:MAG: hypothetical protein H8E46_08740 [FCB group bacterium]|nr:hypothetical protein [FCB group bacterium]